MANPELHGETVARTAERLGRAFAVSLAQVLRDADRALAPILRQSLEGDRAASAVAARGIAMRRQLRAALVQSGYDALVRTSMSAAVERMTASVLASRLVQHGGRLIQPDPLKLQALAELGQHNLLAVADDLAGALWRSLSQWLFTVRPTADILEDLSDVFEDEIAQIQTLFDTQVSIFGRQVEALATAGLDADQPFLYVGPRDQKNRPFCDARVGKVYTRDLIEAMDNDQLANPFVTGGGYNCRHSWMAVESEELRALANTGRRAPEFEAVA